ncbi:arginase 1, mitochondrial-like isoform X2 [Cajanus cajan]|uniref:arginase 1, mitochondrial-like isoform X2 n=1 Tax=Cajanus cajan TaxID=3821 RepID=UPI0010FB2856|nr:arginase 1, mitochondrial-like isoform X2 [Cajanus cajan]
MLRGNFTCENLSRSNFFFFPLNIIVREAIYGETILQSFQFRVSDFARASLSLLFSTLFFNRLLSFKGELVRALGGAKATSTLPGVPLGHNLSFLQGPTFALPRISEAIWRDSTNSTTEEGKELQDMHEC